MFSTDGTRIRLWRTDTDGPDVLLSPGLGASASAWPALSSAKVHSWYHRGTMGSDRPDDPSRITLRDHVADALAVLDAGGVERCVVMGWSMGVTVAAELALQHPDRVSGLLLVAGAPGDSFASMLGVPGLPPDVRRLIGVSSATALRLAGPLLDSVLHRVPVPDVSSTAVGSLRRFLKHDWSWYFTLALALGRTPRQDLTGVTCPTTVLAGRYDWLTSPDSMVGPVSGLPQARVRVLPNTHYLPLENPQVVVEELELLLDRVQAVEQALEDLLTSRSRPRA
ncbi:alpha/beta hydrolase fold containing protein [Saccharothrix espanaensis DSM 44229]|uniref:Alpha/beta hydrolase fold containing protein n=1 Tax=Saccharothrix espanaensis (strain ATCC 51144 / DSM 44229 / JCM 9112 / NBRC 15066 / NRRL 15764) TaxID=1179773 RepID=K0K7U1_SACES|nr:alpha/beta hydrolase fold containing protein [Saccharothrix espanaensis DSM 44229]